MIIMVRMNDGMFASENSMICDCSQHQETVRLYLQQKQTTQMNLWKIFKVVHQTH